MNPGYLTFTFPIGDFDLSKIPIDPAILNASPEMLLEAISDYYADQFRDIGGEAQIAISGGVVNVRWISESGIDGLVEHGVELLRQGVSPLPSRCCSRRWLASQTTLPSSSILAWPLAISAKSKRPSTCWSAS